MAPDIDEGGPTREHSGRGTFSHISVNWPNPMMLVMLDGATTNRSYPVVVGGHRAKAVSTTTGDGGTVERRLTTRGAWSCLELPGALANFSLSHSALFTSPEQVSFLFFQTSVGGQCQGQAE